MSWCSPTVPAAAPRAGRRVALLAAAGAGKLARMDNASYPTALTRAAATFGAVVTLAAVVASTLVALLT